MKKDDLDINNQSCFIQFQKNAKKRQQEKLENLSQMISQYSSNQSRKYPKENKSELNHQYTNHDLSYYTVSNQEPDHISKQFNKKKIGQKNANQPKNQSKLTRVLSSEQLNIPAQFTLLKNNSTSTLLHSDGNLGTAGLKKQKLIEKLEIHKNSLNSIQQKLNKFGIELSTKKQVRHQENKLIKNQMIQEKNIFNHSQSQSNLLKNSKQDRPLTSLKQKQYTLQQVHSKPVFKQDLMSSVNSGGSHHSKKFKMNIQNLIGERFQKSQIEEVFKKPRSFGNQKKSILCKEKQDQNYYNQLKNFSPKSAGSGKSNEKWFKKIDKNLKQTISTQHSSNSTKISINEFSIGKLLGKGKFGHVYICRHKRTGFLSAIKIIKKQTIRKQRSLQQLTRQIKIQSFLNNCNNVKMYTFFDDKQNIYLLLQYCIEGHLYAILKQKKKFSQEEAVCILKDVCQGIKQLHQKNIIHRDIKPENVVICYKMAKLCDYGWSVNCQNQKRQTFCGTPLYVSPQLLTGKTYDYKVDIWALGIMTYQLLTGKLPFQITTQKQLRKIVTNQIKYPNYLSQNAISFMKHLLQKDPNYRNQIQSILKHSFLVDAFTKKQGQQLKKE